jgi:hypothetical protein
VNRKGRVNRSNRDRWEKTEMCVRAGEMPRSLILGHPCTRKSGGSDRPCGRDSEKAGDAVGDLPEHVLAQIWARADVTGMSISIPGLFAS